MSKTAGIALSEFYGEVVKYVGKEIQLTSSQHFSIDYVEDEKMPKYHFQYGFPQSGCVSFSLIADGEYEGQVTDVLVTAPPADKQLITAVFSDNKDLGDGLSVKMKTGFDMGLQEHKSYAEIEANPNAIKMIEIATQDLSKAKILGECLAAVPVGSKRIPVGTAR